MNSPIRQITDTEQFVIIRLYQNKSVYDNRTKPQPILLTDGYYTIPRGYFEPTCGKTQIKPHFEANIRITGDEIGEEVYRSFNVHFWPVFQRETESDKFEDIELAGLGFKAVEKRFFWKKTHIHDVDVELLRYNFKMTRKERKW